MDAPNTKPEVMKMNEFKMDWTMTLCGIGLFGLPLLAGAVALIAGLS
jgi:hypothetical protein